MFGIRHPNNHWHNVPSHWTCAAESEICLVWYQSWSWTSRYDQGNTLECYCRQDPNTDNLPYIHLHAQPSYFDIPIELLLSQISILQDFHPTGCMLNRKKPSHQRQSQTWESPSRRDPQNVQFQPKWIPYQKKLSHRGLLIDVFKCVE